jgi:hypothetical protein
MDLGSRPREALSPGERIVVPGVMTFVIITLLCWVVLLIGFVAAMVRYSVSILFGG